jgi:hypothetical protein
LVTDAAMIVGRRKMEAEKVPGTNGTSLLSGQFVREPIAKRGRAARFSTWDFAEEDQLDFATVPLWSKILSAAVFLGGSFHFDQGRPPCQFIFLPLRHEINFA